MLFTSGKIQNMELSIETLENGIRYVRLSGKMDIQGVNQVGDLLVEKIGCSGDATVVDLEEVDFIASLGMRTLLSTARGVANRSGKMVICNAQPLVKEALKVAGFETLIPMFNSLDEACAELQAA